jgi:glycosyltransferase involved in cell wall biosynthesis
MTSEPASRASFRPDLTIIMPAHCGERWIDATLRSVAAEATDRVELIVVDSSPSPATLEIVRRYADRIRLQLHKRRDLLSWQAKTKFAVSIASSAHICWLHQDDIWLPGRAATVSRWIDAAPDAALHLAPTAIIDAGGTAGWEPGIARCRRDGQCREGCFCRDCSCRTSSQRRPRCSPKRPGRHAAASIMSFGIPPIGTFG